MVISDFGDTNWLPQMGFGLRPSFYEALERVEGNLPPLEFLADNFMAHKGGPSRKHLMVYCARTSVRCLHSVGLNIASTDPLSPVYLQQLKDLANGIEAQVVSDHLCWTRLNNRPTWELMPFPYTQKNLIHVAERVQRVQDFLQRPVTLENVSAYVSFRTNEMTEADFLAELHKRTGNLVLLDVNNSYVSGTNFGRDPWNEILKIPLGAVAQFHVAGHSQEEGFLYDTHDKPVVSAVWNLLKKARRHFGEHLPVTLEHDGPNVPFSVIVEELTLAQEKLSCP